jgi:alkaline phosphatase D
VVQIVDEANGEIVYTLRIAGQSWRPPVFAPGKYTVKVSDPEAGRERVVKGVAAGPGALEKLDVRV